MRARLHGAAEAKAKLKAAGDFIRRREALDIAGEVVLDESYDAFEKSQDPETRHPWLPLKPATIARRRGGRFGVKPLLDTGVLRRSLQRGGPRSIWRYRGAESLTVGTSDPRGVWHQEGTKRGIPARRFLGVAPYTARKISRLMKTAMDRRLERG